MTAFPFENPFIFNRNLIQRKRQIKTKFPILQKFILKRSKVYTTIKDFELLDSKIKKELIMYIDEFYNLIEQPDFYNNYVIHTCKT